MFWKHPWHYLGTRAELPLLPPVAKGSGDSVQDVLQGNPVLL